jgi:hypothetical protein
MPATPPEDDLNTGEHSNRPGILAKDLCTSIVMPDIALRKVSRRAGDDANAPSVV